MPNQPALPSPASLAALRAWLEGETARSAVSRYLGDKKADGQSSRAILGKIRRELVAYAQSRHRADLAQLFEGPQARASQTAKQMAAHIETLRALPPPQPLLGDAISKWLPLRQVQVLHAAGIQTLAELTVRVPRRRRWWSVIPGLGQAGARLVESFFAAQPELTSRAEELVRVDEGSQAIVPWEKFCVPADLDGSRGTLRAPAAGASLRARTDYEAVAAWLELHETPATKRAYRKEVERLMLWSIVERGMPMSSLTTEDALAYRSFLQHPVPQSRWVGPSRPRTSYEWRPFTGALSPESTAYAISVLGALYRWLIEQRYLLANPFAGVKVRSAISSQPLDASKAFTEGEWILIVAVAQGLEWSYGWSVAAAVRLRFVLTFTHATGLRSGELVAARLGDVVSDARGNQWLNVMGKGSKKARVALPPVALEALDGYLAQRGLPVSRSGWKPKTPIVAGLVEEGGAPITAGRLWSVVRRFFLLAAEVVEAEAPATAAKLRAATPHWMRHTHATHALGRGVELLTVRDNLRHASIATTSAYLHGDDAKRATQVGRAFG